jgi:molybdate transport system substrate-binding protein
MSRKLINTLLVVLCLLLAACGSQGGSERAAPAKPVESMQANLTVLAAASLTDAFTELGEVFESQNPGVTVLFSFAGSSELATQLAEGAPADLFASANAQQMQNVVDAGRTAGEPVNFLTNSLVVIVPADNPAGIQTLADLANEGIGFVSAAPDVPIREFTEQVLDNTTADPEYGADFKEAVMANLVSEEANVRQLAAKVALGEADAGIVYKSDVTPDMAGQVRVIEISEAVNVVAVYPIAVVGDSAYPELAQAFVDFVLSDEGQEILNRWGFGPAPT